MHVPTPALRFLDEPDRALFLAKQNHLSLDRQNKPRNRLLQGEKRCSAAHDLPATSYASTPASSCHYDVAYRMYSLQAL